MTRRLLWLPITLLAAATLCAAKPHDSRDPNSKLTSALRQTVASLNAAASAQGVTPLRIARQFENPLMRINTEGEIQVYIRVSNTNSNVQSELSTLGARIVRVADDLKLIEAWVLSDRMQDVAAHPAVTSIRPVGRPVTRAGSVMSQGDAILGADQVRALGYDGSGVKVGVISDDVDNLVAAVASGDLPANVTILQNTPEDRDEGTAMLEIVHDLAPGADLYFYSGWNSSLDMRNGILALADAGCEVIVDDIAWFDQPFFEDGYIAQAVDEVYQRGVVFCSAAGNDARNHYEQQYTPANGVDGFHAWDGASDPILQLVIPPGETLIVLMQWDNPFGASADDYDLYLYDETLTEPIASSEDEQSGAQDPIETLSYVNESSQFVKTTYLAVKRFSGDTRLLELFIWGEELQEWTVVASGSVFGHPAANGAIAVGAINANDVGNNDIAEYSSQGPSRIRYPNSEDRLKPDLCGIDGVSVTGAGGFSTPFYGTSAAAPHVAAVAALLRQAHPTWSAADVRNALTSTAYDIGETGPDYISGAGRVRALEAINFERGYALALPEIMIDDGATFTVPITSDIESAVGVNLAFRFNPAVIAPGTPFIISTAFDDGTLPTIQYKVRGDTILLAMASGLPVDLAGVIAELRFVAVSEGTSPLVWLADRVDVDEELPALIDGSVVVTTAYGDVTSDGSISALDASEILRYVVMIIENINFTRADVSGNGTITAYDGALVLHSVINPAYVFPVEGGPRLKPASPPALAWRSGPDGWSLDVTGNGPIGADVTLRLPDGASVTSNEAFAYSRDGELVTVSVATLGDTELFRVNGMAAPPSVVSASINEQDVSVAIPVPFSLAQNAPNPFNPSTTIRFGLPESGAVSLVIYDVNGRLVRTLVSDDRAAGMHEVVWDARDDAGRAVASGVYVYRLTNQREAIVRRMVLVR